MFLEKIWSEILFHPNLYNVHWKINMRLKNYFKVVLVMSTKKHSQSKETTKFQTELNIALFHNNLTRVCIPQFHYRIWHTDSAENADENEACKAKRKTEIAFQPFMRNIKCQIFTDPFSSRLNFFPISGSEINFLSAGANWWPKFFFQSPNGKMWSPESVGN